MAPQVEYSQRPPHAWAAYAAGPAPAARPMSATSTGRSAWHHRSAWSAPVNQREVDFNAQEVAVRTNTGITWLINDRTTPQQPRSTRPPRRSRTATNTPLNTPRGPAPSAWPDSNGFLDKPYDPVTDLTYVGAREYDATIGRFLSVDPELDESDPQSLAAYTYSDNTPIVASDPTGRMFIMDGGGGGGGGCNAFCIAIRNAIYARIVAEERAAQAAERARERPRRGYRSGCAKSEPPR